ncbi:cupin domain-containing protein [Bacillus lacus]|uniref:Cupin domain-containing protein n=1 Tax=Metabacillus lacus TaxID=1983721 RepID=A0A7X2J2E9_9BACI|nr:cupin domain-containing protein [Metabacillus lacus]MRX74155.1 cupin domain-containing protein [Metabacillus lacus]
MFHHPYLYSYPYGVSEQRYATGGYQHRAGCHCSTKAVPRPAGVVRDYGPNPLVININEATKLNKTFRTALWTGKHFQITLMSLNPGEDIGLEMHPEVDQFLRVEQGQGIVKMGKTKNQLTFQKEVFDDFAIVIPAGTWHNLTNTGNGPLKLYSIYAPPNHPFGTVHATKADALAAEEFHGHSRYQYATVQRTYL